LLVYKNGKKIGFEIKYQDAPTMSRSMRSALDLLKLDELLVIYPGDKIYKLDEKVTVRPLLGFCQENQNP
jgi:hypothetical protein